MNPLFDYLRTLSNVGTVQCNHHHDYWYVELSDEWNNAEPIIYDYIGQHIHNLGRFTICPNRNSLGLHISLIAPTHVCLNDTVWFDIPDDAFQLVKHHRHRLNDHKFEWICIPVNVFNEQDEPIVHNGSHISIGFIGSKH